MSKNGEAVAGDTVFLRAPRIFTSALYRKYGNFALERPHLDDCHHWMAFGPSGAEERLVIHGVIDRQQRTLKKAVVQLHVGVIATEEMSALWLKIDNPVNYMDTNYNALEQIGGVRVSDPVVDYLTERFMGIKASEGELITDEKVLKRIAQYSEFLTVMEMHTGGYASLPTDEAGNTNFLS